MELVYNTVRDYRDVTGREICEIFNRLPSKQELPDYYQVIKRPMENDRILQKMQVNARVRYRNESLMSWCQQWSIQSVN